MAEKGSKDVTKVLKDDGVSQVDLVSFVNLPKIGLTEIKNKMGFGSWAARVAHNKDFGCVLIKQLPDEGNRLHYHPDADECWYITEGTLEWEIEGKGKEVVREGDIIVVEKGTKHKITNIGFVPAIRLAITKPDVAHIYST